MMNFFRDLGYTVARDLPFSGSLVPQWYYRQERGVTSIMIEVNRALYMDEVTGSKKSSFYEVRRVLQKLIRLLGES